MNISCIVWLVWLLSFGIVLRGQKSHIYTKWKWLNLSNYVGLNWYRELWATMWKKEEPEAHRKWETGKTRLITWTGGQSSSSHSHSFQHWMTSCKMKLFKTFTTIRTRKPHKNFLLLNYYLKCKKKSFAN